MLIVGIVSMGVGQLAFAPALKEKDFSDVNWPLVGGTTAGGGLFVVWGILHLMTPRTTVYLP
jgi:hypothetical protein